MGNLGCILPQYKASCGHYKLIFFLLGRQPEGGSPGGIMLDPPLQSDILAHTPNPIAKNKCDLIDKLPKYQIAAKEPNRIMVNLQQDKMKAWKKKKKFILSNNAKPVTTTIWKACMLPHTPPFIFVILTINSSFQHLVHGVTPSG